MTLLAGRGRRLAAAATLALACALAAAVVPTRADAANLRLGMYAGEYASPDAGVRDLWFDRTVETGATLAGIVAGWAAIAPTAPTPGFDATSPSDPRYNWGTLDTQLRDVAAHGLEPVLIVLAAPSWAEGPNRPSTAEAPTGTWKPDPTAFGQFTAALARRYSGSFPDPLNAGRALPRVRYFQVWNEPNLSIYLTPQWSGRRPVAPAHYRKMLNAAYSSIKAVSGSNMVLAPGTAPYGDEPGEERMRPVTFLRSMLCLTSKLKPAKCNGGPAHMDVLAHHPINQFSPTRPAANPNDVATPDLSRLTNVMNAARRSRRVLPRKPKPLWVTEFWWASKPPASYGVPPRKQARWLEQALYVFWVQKVRAAMWLFLRDPENAELLVGSGLYYHDGRPKPSLKAFKFPFVVDPRGGRGAGGRVWGIAPEPGTVKIQLRRPSGWATVKRIPHPRKGIFVRSTTLPRQGTMRALMPSGTASLPWKFR